MPCPPAVPVLRSAGDWILTSTAIPYQKEPASQALHRSKGKSWVHTLHRGMPERKGHERKRKYKLPLDIFKRGIGWRRTENLSESLVKVINAWDYGEMVGQEEKMYSVLITL